MMECRLRFPLEQLEALQLADLSLDLQYELDCYFQDQHVDAPTKVKIYIKQKLKPY